MGARWFDYLLAISLGFMVGLNSVRTWVPVGGPCNWKDGQPCGCNPENGTCAMPCDGCCPHGCWPTKEAR